MIENFKSLMMRIATLSGFPVMVYDPALKAMKKYRADKTEDVPVPSILESSLEKDDIIINFYRKNDTPLIVYFLRFLYDGRKYVVILNDQKTRERLNKFFAAMTICLEESSLQNKQVIARITEMQNGVIYTPDFNGAQHEPIKDEAIDDNSAEAYKKKISYLSGEVESLTEKLKDMELLAKHAINNSGEQQQEGSGIDETSALQLAIAQKESALSKFEAKSNENLALKDAAVKNINIINDLTEQLKVKEAEITKFNQQFEEKDIALSEHDKKYGELKFDFNEMADLVKVVKKSRDKLMTLLDGIYMPMYSVSESRVIAHANRALGNFVSVGNIAKIVGRSCYKTVFGADKPCSWCKLEEVARTGTKATVEVTVNHNGKDRTLEISTFPIFDGVGKIVDLGEFFIDKTDAVEMESSLSKFREQIKTFKRTKISDMNEIQDVKKAYDELSSNYDSVVERNAKVTKALETLMGQDSTKEILANKAELNEYKNRLNRSADAIKNYQRNVEDLQVKYADLNKRTFFQMERLINTINSRAGAKPEEVVSMLNFIGKEFEEVKKTLLADNKRTKQKEEEVKEVQDVQKTEEETV